MNPQQQYAVLALLADLRLHIDNLTAENEALRAQLAEAQAEESA